MLLALFADLVYAACRAGFVSFPLGADISVHLQLSEGSVESCLLDCCIGEGMLLQLSAEVVSIGMAFLLEEKQDERLYKAIEVAHAAGAGVIMAMTRTFLSCTSILLSASHEDRLKASHYHKMQIGVKCIVHFTLFLAAFELRE
jgi:hypothetical protein